MNTQTMWLTNGNRPKTKLAKVTGIVVHWTANEGRGANATANRNYFNRSMTSEKPFVYASAHLIVDDHQLVECIPWRRGVAEMAYHVGAHSYNQGTLNAMGTSYPNNCTIGLEICVNMDGNFKQAFANAIQVTAMMLKEHGLTVNNVFRHYDITYKSCPAFFTDAQYSKKYLGSTDPQGEWKKFKQAVTAAMNPPAPKPIERFTVGVSGGVKATYDGQDAAIKAAQDLFSKTFEGSIVVKKTDGTAVYTPGMHPEAFGKVTNVDQLKVVTTNLNCRDMPVAKGSNVRYVIPNQKVIHIDKSILINGGVWQHTTYGSLGGWVFSQYTKDVPVAAKEVLPEIEPLEEKKNLIEKLLDKLKGSK